MKQYVTIDKRSKKAQKEFYSKQRRTWGELNPATRTVPSEKVYRGRRGRGRSGERRKSYLRLGKEAVFSYNIDMNKIFLRKNHAITIF